MNKGIFNVALEALSEDEHDTPPKGYPKDRSLYAVPEFYMFPLDKEERVKAAITYYSKHDWKANQHPKEAAKRILTAAKKFNIEVGKDTNVYKAAH
jgi:hypothetical protein